MLRNGLEPWHIVILALVIALLFGWKKMPDMARSFGRSARILRAEVDEMKGDKKDGPAAGSATHETPPPNAAPASGTSFAPGVRVQDEAPAGNVTHQTPPTNAAPASGTSFAPGAGVQDDPAKGPAEHTTTTA